MGINNKFYTVHRAKDFSDALDDFDWIVNQKSHVIYW